MPTIEVIQRALPVRDPVLVFALVMWAILLATTIARRFHVPEMIGLLLMGILLGDHGLNILERGETIILLGTVGLLYIMFLAGLELDLHQFLSEQRNSIVFGLLTFAVPMLFGTAMALGVLRFSWPAAILLASMFASHTLVAYPVVTRLGITRNPAVTAAIGGTIITDTLALLVLAVIVASATGILTAWFWARIGLSLAIFVTVVVFGIPVLARYYFHKRSAHGNYDFVFVLAVGFLAAYLAQLAGVEAIIGAFLGGLALNRSIPAQSPLIYQVQFAGNSLFIPFFLLSVGMLVNLQLVFGSWRVWLVGGCMVVTVIATKWFAAYVARRWLGFSKEEGRVMFGLSVAQAAATLAAVFVGFRIGLFGEEVLNGAIMMILVTCLIGPAFVDRYGRSVALHEDMEPLKPGDTPLRILIPLANPGSAADLMNLALMIRRPHSPEPVYPLAVADQAGDVAKQVAASERMLGHAVLYASSAGVPVQPVTRVDTNVANGILRAITELRISTVVIGWTGEPSKKRKALGSVLDRLLRENAQSVLVCRMRHPLNMSRRVILLIPPLMERERGMGEAVRTIKLMTKRLGARFQVELLDREKDRLASHINRIRPSVTTSFCASTPDALWDGQVGAGSPGRDDLLILLSPREGRVAWTSKTSQLPLRLASRHADTNLILFYPPEQDIEPSVSYGLTGMLDPLRTSIGLQTDSLGAAIDALLTPYFKNSDDVQQVRAALERMCSATAAEMAPGLIMVHAHVRQVERPLLFAATLHTPISVPGADHPVRVIFLLLTPIDLPPEEHLRTLAALARLMHQFDPPARIISATTYEELICELARET